MRSLLRRCGRFLYRDSTVPSNSLFSAFSNIHKSIFPVSEEFLYDPTTKTYGDPFARPEVRSGTIEYIAPAEYMVSIFIYGSLLVISINRLNMRE